MTRKQTTKKKASLTHHDLLRKELLTPGQRAFHPSLGELEIASQQSSHSCCTNHLDRHAAAHAVIQASDYSRKIDLERAGKVISLLPQDRGQLLISQTMIDPPPIVSPVLSLSLSLSLHLFISRNQEDRSSVSHLIYQTISVEAGFLKSRVFVPGHLGASIYVQF